MTSQMLLILFGAVVLGVVLLTHGWRGKRLNRHPVCRDCRFDLSGQPGTAMTCPECGSGLRRPRAVRIGQRRKRPLFIAVGGLLAFFPLLLLGACFVAFLSGANIDRYMPLGILLWEAQHGSRPAQVAAELNKRLAARGASKDLQHAVVEVALGVQGDVNTPWCPEWGDVLEAARSAGAMSAPEEQRYLNQALVLDWVARPQVRSSDDIPVTARLRETRLGGACTAIAYIAVKGATVDEQPATLFSVLRDYPGDHQWDAAGEPTGSFQLDGPRASVASPTGTSPLYFAVAKPAGLTPGAHRCTITARVITLEGTTGLPLLQGRAAAKVRGRDCTASIPFDVLPDGRDSVELVTPSEATTAQLKSALEPRLVDVLTGERGAGPGASSIVTMSFKATGLPVDVAYDVSVRWGDRSWYIGRFTSGLSPERDLAGPANSLRTIHGVAQGLRNVHAIKVVLTPSPGGARQTTELTKIYGGEIVFESVDVASAR